jgi:hypothetical protein
MLDIGSQWWYSPKALRRSTSREPRPGIPLVWLSRWWISTPWKAFGFNGRNFVTGSWKSIFPASTSLAIESATKDFVIEPTPYSVCSVAGSAAETSLYPKPLACTTSPFSIMETAMLGSLVSLSLPKAMSSNPWESKLAMCHRLARVVKSPLDSRAHAPPIVRFVGHELGTDGAQ